MTLNIRKLITRHEEVRIEGGKTADPTLHLYGVAAVITNPWAGEEFVDDLRPEILATAPVLVEEMDPRLV